MRWFLVIVVFAACVAAYKTDMRCHESDPKGPTLGAKFRLWGCS